MEEVSRCWADLRSRAYDTRSRAARMLKEQVRVQQKELPVEEFNRFMGELNR